MLTGESKPVQKVKGDKVNCRCDQWQLGPLKVTVISCRKGFLSLPGNKTG
jgi:hypothetical protein